MIQNHRADEEAPHQPLPSACQEQKHGQRDGRNEVILVQPAQFRIAREVLDCVPICGVEPGADNPAEVRPPKAFLHRRMNVPFLVAVLVMSAMMCRPPQRALLHCRSPKQRKHKLKDAAGLE